MKRSQNEKEKVSLLDAYEVYSEVEPIKSLEQLQSLVNKGLHKRALDRKLPFNLENIDENIDDQIQLISQSILYLRKKTKYVQITCVFVSALAILIALLAVIMVAL